jgi:8-oxo-dGTP pyrophosphatase MutT (NUDIX family)
MNKSTELKRSISCGTVTYRIIDKQVSILLIKQFSHKDSWGIPKGHIDAGESFEECAIRETREETGVEVKLETVLPEMTAIWHNDHKRVISFLAQPVGNSDPNCGDPDCEVADVRWFNINELPPLHLYQREMLAYVCGLLRSQHE